jgi:hypothetical protein
MFTLQTHSKIENEIFAAHFHAGFLSGSFFDPEDGGHVSPKRRLTFNWLHGVISQMENEMYVFNNRPNLGLVACELQKEVYSPRI